MSQLRTPVKRNRFISISGGTRSVNRALETKARTLAGWKGYVTNLVDADPAFVIGAYHQLWQIEKSFRMSKSDLAARPIFHHKRESIEAHLAVVFAALAVSRWVEHETGSSIRRFVKTARRYREPSQESGHVAGHRRGPSPSRPANTPSPPPTLYQATSPTRSEPSTTTGLRTSLIKVGSGSKAGGDAPVQLDEPVDGLGHALGDAIGVDLDAAAASRLELREYYGQVCSSRR